jgi:hypothetical protein
MKYHGTLLRLSYQKAAGRSSPARLKRIPSVLNSSPKVSASGPFAVARIDHGVLHMIAHSGLHAGLAAQISSHPVPSTSLSNCRWHRTGAIEAVRQFMADCGAGVAVIGRLIEAQIK